MARQHARQAQFRAYIQDLAADDDPQHTLDEFSPTVVEWMAQEGHTLPSAARVLGWPDADEFARILPPWRRRQPVSKSTVKRLSSRLGAIRALGRDDAWWHEMLLPQRPVNKRFSWRATASLNDRLRVISDERLSVAIVRTMAERRLMFTETCASLGINNTTLSHWLGFAGYSEKGSYHPPRSYHHIASLAVFLAGEDASDPDVERKMHQTFRWIA